jgi:P27 family predicted phage terminase small subunit
MPKRGPKAKYVGPSKSKVAAPEGLNAEEAREFKRLVEALRSRGTLERCDVRLIEAASKTFVLLGRAHDELGHEPLTSEAANGTPMPHPMIGVINSLTMRLRGLLGDLGLTPKTSGLGDAPGDAGAEDHWDGVLNVAG